MKRLASEVIKELQKRVARLERKASTSKKSFYDEYDLDSYIIEDMEDEGVVPQTQQVIEQEVTRSGTLMLVEGETSRGREIYFVVLANSSRQIVLDSFKNRRQAEKRFGTEVAERNSTGYGSLGHRLASFDEIYDLDSYVIEDMSDEVGVEVYDSTIIDQQVTINGTYALVEAETEEGDEAFFVIVSDKRGQKVLSSFSSLRKAEKSFARLTAYGVNESPNFEDAKNKLRSRSTLPYRRR